MKHIWLYINASDLETEVRQCEDEGRDLSVLQREISRLRELDLEEPRNQPAVENLFDATIECPIKPDFPFYEPSELDEIRSARPAERPVLPSRQIPRTELLDRLHGAWTGRCAGCLLGKPVEGWRRPRMWGYLKDLGRWPLDDYFYFHVSDQIREKYALAGPESGGTFADLVDAMPEDDDTNYTTAGLAIWKKYGADFTPENVAEFWLREIPILHTCTAERVAYRNLCLLIPPPHSASYRNPYREWIGAQIRADFWGFAAPGNPERAAEYAWRDACVSHVKNGIYGEMWAAAMIAASFVTDDRLTIVEAGLGEIPERCRLADSLRQVIRWKREGVDYDSAVERLHGIWDENSAHHWCHTISNAMVVAIALLWGEGGFAETICRAVQCCFDTDCNGATTGSILGIIHGRRNLPPQWVDVIQDTLHTGVAGYHRVTLTDMASETAELTMHTVSGGGA